MGRLDAAQRKWLADPGVMVGGDLSKVLAEALNAAGEATPPAAQPMEVLEDRRREFRRAVRSGWPSSSAPRTIPSECMSSVVTKSNNSVARWPSPRTNSDGDTCLSAKSPPNTAAPTNGAPATCFAGNCSR